MSVEVRVTGVGALSRELRRRQANLEAPNPAWSEVSRHIAREVRKQFTTRGAHFGTPWAPLAPATIAAKIRGGWPRQPLVRTGKLKRDFTSSPLDIEDFRGNVAVFGASSDVAGYQHYGTRTIPARVILKVTPQLRQEIRNILERHINGES